MKILVLSDSLALPRSKPEHCGIEDTWPELLRRSGHVVHQVSIGGATSSDLYRQCTYYMAIEADVVIVQVGIVDCAPRFLTKIEQNALKKIPILGSRLMKALNRPSVRRLRKLTYTRLPLFRKNISGISKSFANTPCFFIGILPSLPTYERIMPGVKENILLYNKVLQSCKGYISVDEMPVEGIMSDHHHLNQQGHRFIFEKIIASIACEQPSY